MSHVQTKASLCVDSQVVGKSAGLLRNRSINLGVVLGRSHVARRLNVERRHWLVLEHGKVDGSWDGATSLALVTLRGTHARVHLVEVPLLRKHVLVVLRERGLGRRSSCGRNGSRR